MGLDSLENYVWNYDVVDDLNKAAIFRPILLPKGQGS